MWGLIPSLIYWEQRNVFFVCFAFDLFSRGISIPVRQKERGLEQIQDSSVREILRGSFRERNQLEEKQINVCCFSAYVRYIASTFSRIRLRQNFTIVYIWQIFIYLTALGLIVEYSFHEDNTIYQDLSLHRIINFEKHVCSGHVFCNVTKEFSVGSWIFLYSFSS